jgi:hypothetical protein
MVKIAILFVALKDVLIYTEKQINITKVNT